MRKLELRGVKFMVYEKSFRVQIGDFYSPFIRCEPEHMDDTIDSISILVIGARHHQCLVDLDSVDKNLEFLQGEMND